MEPKFQSESHKPVQVLCCRVLLFPRLWPFSDIHSGLLALLEEGRATLVGRVVRLKPDALQQPAAHLHDRSLCFQGLQKNRWVIQRSKAERKISGRTKMSRPRLSCFREQERNLSDLIGGSSSRDWISISQVNRFVCLAWIRARLTIKHFSLSSLVCPIWQWEACWIKLFTFKLSGLKYLSLQRVETTRRVFESSYLIRKLESLGRDSNTQPSLARATKLPGPKPCVLVHLQFQGSKYHQEMEKIQK